MTRILCMAQVELTISRRNLWVVTAVGLMLVFALVLTAAGNTSSAGLRIDALAVAVASMTTLSVYLVPLIALLLAFDAISGERDRGTLDLLVTYPTNRAEILIAKLTAHLLVLMLAIFVGFGGAAAVTLWTAGVPESESLWALARLMGSAVLLGATFLALGYLVSALSRQSAAAAGAAIAVWIVFVVLYDLALLGALVADDTGVFSRTVFPWLLLVNPADAFRTFNFIGSGLGGEASGLVGTPESVPPARAFAALAVWPFLALALAWLGLRKAEQ